MFKRLLKNVKDEAEASCRETERQAKIFEHELEKNRQAVTNVLRRLPSNENRGWDSND